MSRFSQSGLETALADLVPELRFLEETTSTNAVASDWAAQGAPDGAIVVTDHQTAGRGRLDRSWYAPPGECLLFSMVLTPRARPDQLGLLNLAAAAALCLSLRPHTPARVKWPNDVMMGGRKVAGILSEGSESFAVVGVGLNVNVAEFPGELAGTATSLLRETGAPADRLELLRGYLEEFDRLYASFPEGVVSAYEPLCETLGLRVRVQLPDRALEDEATGIDPTGGLVLAGGEIVRAGDVVHTRSAGGA